MCTDARKGKGKHIHTQERKEGPHLFGSTVKVDQHHVVALLVCQQLVQEKGGLLCTWFCDPVRGVYHKDDNVPATQNTHAIT